MFYINIHFVIFIKHLNSFRKLN